MHAWVVATYEPLPDLDASSRLLRCGMLVDQLRSDGDEVTWWTSTFHHVRKENRFETSRTLAARNGARLELLHAPPYRRNVSLRRVAHNRAMAHAFAERTQRSEELPDVIFAAVPSLELAESALRYGQARGIPVVVDARDKWPDVYLTAVPRALRGMARQALSVEFERARRIFQGASGITAISDDYLDWALAYASRPRALTDCVVPLGFPVPRDPAGEALAERGRRLRQVIGVDATVPLATFLGMFGMSYDLECVVEAARRLHAAGESKVHIVLAGTGESLPRVRRLAAGLPNVHFTGWLDQADAWALLHTSTLGLAPYRRSALQSLPNKAFEYMAAGLPVVSSLSGELQQLLDAEAIGVTYRAGDPDALADAIRLAVDSPEGRRSMAARARDLYRRRYSTAAIYDTLARHLRMVASRSRDVGLAAAPTTRLAVGGGL
jgi:glycosyltransferase involved in cell wall biosynthesis